VPDTASKTREPAWLLFLAGWLAIDVLRPSAAGRVMGPARGGPPDLTRMSPRELRRLPGIGETLAIAIAEARWEHGDKPYPLFLSDVAGIGERTAERVRQWLEEHGGPAAGARAMPGSESAPATVDSP
jgi:hypothetical protein